MLGYFSKFSTSEKTVREAVGEVTENYRLADQIAESPNKRLTTMGVTYGHGSPEPKPGTVRAPGTRREGKGPQRPQRWAGI